MSDQGTVSLGSGGSGGIAQTHDLRMRQEAKDRRHMGLAFHVAGWSKDPSTKVGCVVVGTHARNIAFGYNGFPPGIADTEDRLSDREVKYRLTQHAERNALDNAVFDLTGGRLISTLFPCIECAKSIVSKGIRTVVTTSTSIPSGSFGAASQSAEWAAELFKEAGVEVVVLEVKTAPIKRGP